MHYSIIITAMSKKPASTAGDWTARASAQHTPHLTPMVPLEGGEPHGIDKHIKSFKEFSYIKDIGVKEFFWLNKGIKG